MFPNIGDLSTGVKRPGPRILRARDPESHTPTPPTAQAGFVRVPHEVTATRGLSDAAFRAWVAVQQWSWRGASPSNAQIALACGWAGLAGRPSLTKAKRALRELEAAGLIARVIAARDGRVVREAIEVCGTASTTRPGSSPARPPAGSAPPVGPAMTRGGGSDSAPSEDRCRRREDPQGAKSLGTTTTRRAGSSPTPAEIEQGRAIEPQQTPTGPSGPAPTIPAGLTAGQAAFLKGLSAQERERFDALPRSAQAKHLEMFRGGGDETIRRHVLATLQPPRARGPIPTPEDDVPALLAAVAAGRSPNAALSLAGRLARELGDHKSFRYYLSKAEEASLGHRPLASLAEAYRQASGPQARNPAAVFVHALKSWDAGGGRPG